MVARLGDCSFDLQAHRTSHPSVEWHTLAVEMPVSGPYHDDKSQISVEMCRQVSRHLPHAYEKPTQNGRERRENPVNRTQGDHVSTSNHGPSQAIDEVCLESAFSTLGIRGNQPATIITPINEF
jgi:hypothetical protein